MIIPYATSIPVQKEPSYFVNVTERQYAHELFTTEKMKYLISRHLFETTDEPFMMMHDIRTIFPVQIIKMIGLSGEEKFSSQLTLTFHNTPKIYNVQVEILRTHPYPSQKYRITSIQCNPWI